LPQIIATRNLSSGTALRMKLPLNWSSGLVSRNGPVFRLACNGWRFLSIGRQWSLLTTT